MVAQLRIRNIECQLHCAQRRRTRPETAAPEKSTLLDIPLADTVVQPRPQGGIENIGNVLYALRGMGILQTHQQIQLDANIVRL